MRRRALLIACIFSAVGAPSLYAQSSRLTIVEAARTGNKAALQSLIAQHVDVNQADRDGTTALDWASRSGDVDAVASLIGAGANVDATNDYGVTALSLACTAGRVLAAKALLDGGADPELRTSGETALMTAARTGSLDLVKLLIDYGADSSVVEPHSGQTLLMLASAEGHSSIVQLLIERGAQVKARSRAGFAPLLFAVRSGDLSSVRLLVAAGADVNGTAPDGTTNLVVAIRNGHYELAKYLLEHGANPNADSAGCTALHALIDTMNWDGLGLPDVELTGTGNLTSRDFLHLLLAAGVDVNARLTKERVNFSRSTTYVLDSAVGATPFWLAARAGDVETMKELLARGADPHIATKSGTTPLMVAAGVDFVDGVTPGTEAQALAAVRLAFDQGDNVNAVQGIDPACKPQNYTGHASGRVCGWTALHGAAARGADSIVQFLVDHGANLEARDKTGKTPVEVARFSSLTANVYVRESTAKLLESLMAQRHLPIPPQKASP